MVERSRAHRFQPAYADQENAAHQPAVAINDSAGLRQLQQEMIYLMLTGRQRIWAFFRTQRELPMLKEAICLPSSRAIKAISLRDLL
jgi:hypothetical protein